MKQKRIITKDFFIGNLGDTKATDEVLESYKSIVGKEIYELTQYDNVALVGGVDSPDEKLRKCYLSWLPVSQSNFIEVGLRKIVENVNNLTWKIQLDSEWEAKIQFTKYVGKGDHYEWHRDYYDNCSKDHGIGIRRLSVVYCLSKKSDYTGGEFQIRTNNNGVYTTKFDYGDFIVFPSDKLHRVKPLKTGTRVTMVGWYR
jgi:PKHD-type hydroxylase